MSDRELPNSFRLENWTVEPQLNRLSLDGRSVDIEPKSMAVLVYLAGRPGQVISSDELIDAIWDGRPMGDNPVHRCVSRLRHALGDDARRPRFIGTVQRKGYRLVCRVQPAAGDAAARSDGGGGRRKYVVLAGIVTATVLVAAYFLSTRGDTTPSISVQLFDSLESPAYFAKGVSEDIRSGLANVDGLVVASRSASTQFPSGTDPKRIGALLDVSWVLEGTVRIDNGNVKVTASLINANSRYVIWSETFAGKIADLFDIQDRIARAVIREVISTLPARFHLQLSGTDVISAYNEYLKGKAKLDEEQPDASLAEAEAHFLKALEHDPQYGRAYAGLCRTYTASYALKDAAEYIGKAEQACGDARALSPSLSQVPDSLGRLFRQRGKLDLAVQAFEESIALNANDVGVLTTLAQTLAKQGNKERAETVFEDALKRQPNDWLGYMRFGHYLFGDGRYPDAARMYQRVVELRAPSTQSFNNLGAALYLMGDIEMAAKAFEESLRIKPNRSAQSNLGTVRYYLGQYAEAIALYRAAIEDKPQDFVMWGNLGDALGQAGDPGAADAYRQAIELAFKQLEINEREAETHAMIGSYQAHLGFFDAAISRIESAIGYSPELPYVRYYAAVVHTIVGDKDRALTELSTAVAHGYPLSLALIDPEFLALRGMSRFEELRSGASEASGSL